MTRTILILVTLLLSNLLTSQVIATTEDGVKVILEDDNTWRFAKSITQNSSSSNSGEAAIKNETPKDNILKTPKEPATKIGFRGFFWGDSVEKLKSKNPNINWKTGTEDGLKFYVKEDYVGGKQVEVLFLFSKSKLVAGMYNFIEEYQSDNAYYQDYTRISETLSDKYEMEKSENWNNETWRNSPNYIGHAIQSGHVEFSESYDDGNTTITHTIKTDNEYGVEHMLMYRSSSFLKSIINSQDTDF